MSLEPRIRRLSDDLVNKIAAGEVVERPSSVVKELVENALDAGARNVWVEVEGGGKTLVRVRDDGSGMTRVDAVAALERHATSKLATLQDLQAIETHGFRGEALPSIASVAHLVLRTRMEGESEGTIVEVRFGKRSEPRAAGHPPGTTVEVRDLFGAVPARRKFLRSEQTELGHLAESLSTLALARTDVAFTLSSHGRPLIQAPAVASLRDRIFQLFGERTMSSLVEVEGGYEWARVSGFVSRPDTPVTPRPTIRLFVNRRAVRDRSLSKALTEAYRGAAAEDRLSEAFLFIEAPTHMVDVNVHPAKSEVRFADPRVVFRAVETAVRDSLSRGTRVAPKAAASRVAEAVARYGEALAPAGRRAAGRAAAAVQTALAAEGPAAAAPEAPIVLGQHKDTYIVATDGVEIVLYDQHTAHERVRFEQLVKGQAEGRCPSQRLLEPHVVRLAPALVALVEEHEAILGRLGFEVAPFGGGTVRVGAVPAGLAGRDPLRELESVLQDFSAREGDEWLVGTAEERLAATVACHSVVRAGQTLAREVLAAIVRDLAATTHPTLCPHGRPTVVRIPADDVARWFGRVGWRRG